VRGCAGEQLLFAVDQVAGVERGQLETMAVRDGVGGAGLDAIAAEDATVVIDVVDLGVTLGAADAMRFRVLRRLDVNAIRRACRSAQEAGNTFLQPVLI